MILSWLRHFFRSRDRRQLEEELQFHLQHLIELKMSEGLPPAEARRQAYIEFGGLEAVREQSEQARPGWWAGTLIQDFQYALRGLRRNPSFAIAVVLTLMLGIGSTSAVFSVVDRILFRPLPYADSSRLVSVGLVAPIEPQEFMLGGSYYEWQDNQKPFRALTSETGVAPCDLTEENPQRLDCASVESNFLPTLGVLPVAGRNFLPEEDRPDAPRVALISYSLWRSRFHLDPSIAGRVIKIDGIPTRVTGVLPKDFEMPRLQPADILVPEALDVAAQRRADPGRPMWAFARLKPGVTAEAATAQLSPLFQYSLRLAPAPFRKEVHYVVRPLRDRQFHEVHQAAWILFALVVAVLLIACANVASLFTARQAARERELAIRAALGAGRMRLLQQAIAESLVLSVAGCVMGMLFAAALLRLFILIAPSGMPFLSAASIDLRVLCFALCVSMLSAIAFACVGGFARSRAHALTTRNAWSARHARLRQTLVAGQMATSLLLLTGGALLARSFWNLQTQSLGMNAEKIVTGVITLGQNAYPTPERQRAFFQQLQQNLRWGPGVDAVAISDSLPPGGVHRDQIYASLRMEGQPKLAMGTGGNVAWRWVTPAYFRALTIPMVEGNGFTSEEETSSNHFVVLSRSLANRMLPGQSPLGKQIHLAANSPADQDPLYTVAGVAADVKNGGLAAGEEPEYYRLRRDRAEDWDRSGVLVIKANLPADSVERWLRSQVAALDPSLPVEISTLQQRVEKLADQPRFEMLLVGYFACAGLLLAVVGLFGVTSFLMVERKPEIGVRIALGARKGDVVRLVLWSALRMILPGALIGLILSLALSRILGSLLFHVKPYDPAAFLAATTLLVVTTIVAALFPAYESSRVDPMITLRAE
jgi:putative ABC transport system permease protein